jgi:hypothetical protein
MIILLIAYLNCSSFLQTSNSTGLRHDIYEKNKTWIYSSSLLIFNSTKYLCFHIFLYSVYNLMRLEVGDWGRNMVGNIDLLCFALLTISPYLVSLHNCHNSLVKQLLLSPHFTDGETDTERGIHL